MEEWRFKETKKFVPMIHADVGRKENNPWWQIVSAIEEFNLNRSVCVASSIWKIFDESMSAIRPQTTSSGNLPHLSFVKRKPEPLVAVSVRLPELSKREREREGHDVDKDLTEDVRKVEDTKTDIYQGDLWLALIPSLKLIQSRVGCCFKGFVKAAHAGFPKDYLEETMKNFPRGFHMVLRLLWTMMNQKESKCMLLDINIPLEKFSPSLFLRIQEQPYLEKAKRLGGLIGIKTLIVGRLID